MNLYLNGEFMPIEDGRVSVEDRGFQFGDGVYEVVRFYGGKPFRLGEHLKRLEESLAGVEIPLPEPLSRMEEVCRKVAAGLREASVYLQVTRGAAPRVHAWPGGLLPTFVAYARELKPHAPDRTYTLKVVPDDRWGRCHLKVICLLPNILAKQKAASAGCDEALLVREDGAVTEGASSNAFMVRGGEVFTHPPTNRILNGVTRMTVLETARAEGVAVREESFSLQEARSADEFFMTGTLTELMPAVSIDGRPVGSGKAGPVTLKLRTAFRERVAREVS